MIFGKYINRYYLRSAPVLLLGLLALLTVDYIQLMIPSCTAWSSTALTWERSSSADRPSPLPKRCCSSISACP